MGGMGPLVVVDGDPAPDPSFGLRSGFPGVQVDAFTRQGPPETRQVEGIPAIGPKECPRVVEAAPLPVHRYPGAHPFEPVSPCKGRELKALNGIHDLGWAELVDRLVQRLDAEAGFQRVRYPPGQHFAGEPVHDGNQIQKALSHRQIDQLACPDDQRADAGADQSAAQEHQRGGEAAHRQSSGRHSRDPRPGHDSGEGRGIGGETSEVADQRVDPARIKAAKAMPYQLLATLRALEAGVDPRLRDALHDAMEASVSNVPVLQGSVAVCPDVSGLMSSPAPG